MSNWSFIPPEILDCIFKSVERKDLIPSRLVCKSWSLLASIRLFQSVDLFTQAKLDQLFELSIGQYISHVYLKTSIIQKEVQYLSKLVKHCPNITFIDFNHHLRNMWRLLAYMPWRLQQLPAPYASETCAYFDCAFTYRDSIVSLCIPQYVQSEPVSKHGLFLLPQFRKLTHLNFRSSYFGQSLMAYDAVIEACPHLVSVKIGQTQAYTDYPVDSPLQQRVIPCHLKELRVTLVYFPGTFDYLMRKFPDLNRLELRTPLSSMVDEVADELQAYFAVHSKAVIHYIVAIEMHEVVLPFTKELLETCLDSKVLKRPEVFVCQSYKPNILIQSRDVVVYMNEYEQWKELFDAYALNVIHRI